TPDKYETLVAWNLLTGKRAFGLKGPGESARFGQFLSDGRTFVTIDVTTRTTDITTYKWTLDHWDAGSKLPRLGTPQLTREALDAAWADLAAAGAVRGRKALWDLAASPDRSLPFLRRQIRSLPDADAGQVGPLVAALDGKRFADRERAQAELG